MATIASGPVGSQQRNQQATVWVGGIDDQASEELLFELFINAGPIVSVTLPRDKITGMHSNYAFVEFQTVEDAEYCIRVFSNVRLYGRNLRINRAAKIESEEEEFHAKVFVGNLDEEIDERGLFETFSQFGAVISARVMTHEDSLKSKGFGFVTFASFEDADRAIEAMNGQFLANRPVHVNYAFKKDGVKGERHGSKAERELAARSALHRIRNPLGKLPQAHVETPTFLGGRVAAPGAATGSNALPIISAPPPPPPPQQMMPPPLQNAFGGPPARPPPPLPGTWGVVPHNMPPPPPPNHMGQGFHQGAPPPPPPPPPQMGGAYQQYRPPPPPPQMMGFQPQYGMPPPPPGFQQYHHHMPPPPPGFQQSPPPGLQQPQHQQPPQQQQFMQPPPPMSFMPPGLQPQQQAMRPPGL